MAANEYQKIIDQCKKEEKLLQFKSFSLEEGFKLGTFLYNCAKEEKLGLAIDIRWNGQKVFHAALEGTKPDNDTWIERKINVVNRYQMSSFQFKNYAFSNFYLDNGVEII